MIYNAIQVRRAAYRIFVEESKRERPLVRRKRRWEDNIKMNPREVGYGGMDWIHLTQDKDQ
jgi:hypothetical protein